MVDGGDRLGRRLAPGDRAGDVVRRDEEHHEHRRRDHPEHDERRAAIRRTRKRIIVLLLKQPLAARVERVADAVAEQVERQRRDQQEDGPGKSTNHHATW